MGLLLSIILVSGCVRLGCTDPIANNYDENATEDDGSCEYSFISRKVSFSTNLAQGGDIYIELSNQNGYSGTSYSDNVWFNKDTTDELWPLCGVSKMATFERQFEGPFHYDAHDRHGFTWNGSVSLDPGDCRVIELTRKKTDYGVLLFYSSKDISPDDFQLEIKVNPTGGIYDDYRTKSVLYREIYSSSIPNCSNLTNSVSIETKSGTASVVLRKQGTTSSINVEVPQGGCRVVDLASYF